MGAVFLDLDRRLIYWSVDSRRTLTGNRLVPCILEIKYGSSFLPALDFLGRLPTGDAALAAGL